LAGEGSVGHALSNEQRRINEPEDGDASRPIPLVRPVWKSRIGVAAVRSVVCLLDYPNRQFRFYIDPLAVALS